MIGHDIYAQRFTSLGLPASDTVFYKSNVNYQGFSDSPFTATYREDFEDGPFNAPGIAKSTGLVRGPSSLTDSVDIGGHSLHITQNELTLSFDRAAFNGIFPTQVGLAITDIEDSASAAPGYGSVQLQAFDYQQQQLGSRSYPVWLGAVTLPRGHRDGEPRPPLNRKPIVV